MAPTHTLAEFEHLVMLAVLQLGDEARALDLRQYIEERAERSVSRGALYTTLERLENKDFLTWKTEESTPERGGIPRRRYIPTATGVEAVRASSRVIARMTEGLEGLI